MEGIDTGWEEEGDSVDKDLAGKIDLFRPFLLRIVRSSDLLPFMAFILNDSGSRIRKLDDEGKQVEAMEMLLQCLQQTEGAPGRYAAFRDALRHAGYDHVVSVLEGDSVEDNFDEHCQLLKIFSNSISEKLDPILLMRHLRPHGLLTLRDESVIRNLESQRSPEHAVFMFLDLVHRRKRGWYQILMTKMFEAYPDLVNEIDPCFKEQLEMQQQVSTETEMETMDQPIISATGEGHCSMNLYAENHGKRPTDNDDTDLTQVKRRKSENVATAAAEEDSSRQPDTKSLSEEQKEELYIAIKERFITNVDARQLMIHLKIGDADEEKISEIKGRQPAAHELLKITRRKCKDWPDEVCSALRNPNIAMDYLAEEIETHQQSIVKSKTGTDGKMVAANIDENHDFESIESNTAMSENSLGTSQTDSKSQEASKVNLQLNINPKLEANLKMDNLKKDVDEIITPKCLSTDSHMSTEGRENTSNENIGRQEQESMEKTNTDGVQGKCEHKVLELRPYQSELAQDALEGRNCIICAPTNSGKTIVAIKVMQEHLKMRGIRKIAFFANQNVLVDQQYKRIKEFMPEDTVIERVSGNNADTMKIPLNDLVTQKDILVLTPQILEDALSKGEVSSISRFSLLVFDECHHTRQRHVFNCLMFRYMRIKLDDSIKPGDSLPRRNNDHLPQIVGLTASVGVGGAKDTAGALKHVKELCANLDAWGGVSMVQKHKEDLAMRNTATSTEFVATEERKLDIFKTVISDKLMKGVEEKMRRSNYVVSVKDFSEILKPPLEREGQQYETWLSNIFRATVQINDSQIRRFFLAHRTHLEIYHKSLELNAACRTKDAVDLLNEKMNGLHQSRSNMNATDKALMKLYEDSLPDLEGAAENPECINPKLSALKDMITKKGSDDKDCSVLVFVKTKELASAMLEWMKDDPELSRLQPLMCVGKGSSVSRGGMTRQDQNKAVESFRKIDHKVMIATSVAEEGVDFEACNLVIQYQYVSNEIAMVQAKGRARAEDSNFVLLTGQDGHRVLEKGELNISREVNMNRALKQLLKQIADDPQKFRRDLEDLQQTAKMVRDREASTGGNRAIKEGVFALRCIKCDNFACLSSDIRTVEKNHHVVLDESFQTKLIVKPHPKGKVDLQTIQIASKIYCANKCDQDWGVAILYNNATFPVLKINSFIIRDSEDKTHLAKKWNKAPFEISEMMPEEFRNYHSLELGLLE